MGRRAIAARRRMASWVVPRSIDGLHAELLSRPRWVERRMPVWGTVCDGFVYIERRKDGFVVWSADRDEAHDMDSPAVRVVASADPRGTRLEVRRTMTRRSRAGVALLCAITATLVLGVGALVLLGTTPGLLVLVPMGVILTMTWASMAAQWSAATARSNDVWDELSAAVTPLALPTGSASAAR